MAAGDHQGHDFEVRIDSADGIGTVSVAGQLDIGTVEICLAQIDRHSPNGDTKVVVDLREVTFIDAAGFRALVTARERISRQGREVEFVNAPPVVTRVTQILGVDLSGEPVSSSQEQYG